MAGEITRLLWNHGSIRPCRYGSIFLRGWYAFGAGWLASPVFLQRGSWSRFIYVYFVPGHRSGIL